MPEQLESSSVPLLAASDDGKHDTEALSPLPATKPRRTRVTWSVALTALSLVANAALLWVFLSERKQRAFLIPWRGDDRPVYTPIQDTIRYENRVFPHLTDTTKYHGPPTDAVDANWDDIYSFGISALPTSEVVKMANYSVPIKGHEDHHLIQLDIFHHLHCLNGLRKFISLERYPEMNETRYAVIKGIPFDHIDHCINALRETLMCSPDLSADVWRTDPVDGKSKVQFNTVHTCVNWDSVREWALKNEVLYDDDSPPTLLPGGEGNATNSAHEGHMHGSAHA